MGTNTTKCCGWYGVCILVQLSQELSTVHHHMVDMTQSRNKSLTRSRVGIWPSLSCAVREFCAVASRCQGSVPTMDTDVEGLILPKPYKKVWAPTTPEACRKDLLEERPPAAAAHMPLKAFTIIALFIFLGRGALKTDPYKADCTTTSHKTLSIVEQPKS